MTRSQALPALVCVLAVAIAGCTRSNERAQALAASICSAAKPGASISAIKLNFPRRKDQLQLSESPSEALFVAQGFGTFIFMCQIKVNRGVVVSARYSEDS
jgi:nitrous oxide reductase accessory protein NosL